MSFRVVIKNVGSAVSLYSVGAGEVVPVVSKGCFSSPND